MSIRSNGAASLLSNLVRSTKNSPLAAPLSVSSRGLSSTSRASSNPACQPRSQSVHRSQSNPPLLLHSKRTSKLGVSRPRPTGNGVQTRSFQNMLAPDPASSDAPNLAINKLTPRGFVLSDNLVIPGGAIFHSGRAILWDVDPPSSDPGVMGKGLEAMWSGWGPERFRVFEVVVPRPEILLFGTGQTAVPAPKAIREYISSLGIQLDVMDTRNAASTYNLLAEEGRTVSAALCPLNGLDPRTGEAR